LEDIREAHQMTMAAKLMKIVCFVLTCVGVMIFTYNGKTDRLGRMLGWLGIALIAFGILCEFYAAIVYYY
jgi:hypothetical protein